MWFKTITVADLPLRVLSYFLNSGSLPSHGGYSKDFNLLKGVNNVFSNPFGISGHLLQTWITTDELYGVLFFGYFILRYVGFKDFNCSIYFFSF